MVTMGFGVPLALLGVVFWALADQVTKFSLDRASKWRVLFLSQLFGGGIILAVTMLLGEADKWLEILPWLIGLGLVNFIGMLTFYEAIKAKGVALTASITNAYPFITVVLGFLIYKEPVSLHQIIAILLILAGMFTITLKNGKRLFDRSFLIALVSMAVWGVLFFILKIPVSIAGALLVTAGLKLATPVASLPVLFLKKISPIETKHKLLALIAAVGVLDSLGLLAYTFAIKDAPVSTIAPIVAAVPALSVILAVVFLKERLSLHQTVGILAAMAGIFLISA